MKIVRPGDPDRMPKPLYEHIHDCPHCGAGVQIEQGDTLLLADYVVTNDGKSAPTTLRTRCAACGRGLTIHVSALWVDQSNTVPGEPAGATDYRIN